MPTPSSPGQGGLFDAEPGPNSPEDLGYRAPQAPETEVAGPTAPDSNATAEPEPRPPYRQAYGDPSPEPDPYPRNMASSAVQIEDARRLVEWLGEQDIPVHADCTVGHILVGLSGLGRPDLKWLCQAIRQAGNAPAPNQMRGAILKHDVGLLRGD